MPFGLTNAPASQQALLNSMFYKYLDDFIIIYLNNILIFSKGLKKDHIEKVKKVLQKLMPYNRLLKLKKCEFFKKEIAFLSYIITTEKIQIDPEKIKAILE
jgi:acetolactate synthase small subunit